MMFVTSTYQVTRTSTASGHASAPQNMHAYMYMYIGHSFYKSKYAFALELRARHTRIAMRIAQLREKLDYYSFSSSDS